MSQTPDMSLRCPTPPAHTPERSPDPPVSPPSPTPPHHELRQQLDALKDELEDQSRALDKLKSQMKLACKYSLASYQNLLARSEGAPVLPHPSELHLPTGKVLVHRARDGTTYAHSTVKATVLCGCEGQWTPCALMPKVTTQLWSPVPNFKVKLEDNASSSTLMQISEDEVHGCESTQEKHKKSSKARPAFRLPAPRLGSRIKPLL